jgi:hypothetical protein
MSDITSLSNGKEKIPPSIRVQSNDFHIYRGTPSQMIFEMMDGSGEQTTLREAIQKLVHHLASTNRLQIQLPWDQPDELLAALFIHSLLITGIVRPTPLA